MLPLLPWHIHTHTLSPADLCCIKWPWLFEVTMAVRAEQQHSSHRGREQRKNAGTGKERTERGPEDPLMSTRCGEGKAFPAEKLK